MELITRTKGVNGDFIGIYQIKDGSKIMMNERTGYIIGTIDEIIRNQETIDKIKIDYIHLKH